MSNEAVKTDELNRVSVPTKKVYFLLDEEQELEIVLRPFKQLHFAVAIEIINKYFEKYKDINQQFITERQAIIDNLDNNYSQERKEIFTNFQDESARNTALKESDERFEMIRHDALVNFAKNFNEGMKIAKAIMSCGQDVKADIENIILFSVFKSTLITTENEEKTKSPYELVLDNLTWGENLILLGTAIGLNMDFFDQNSEAMNLVAIREDAAKPKQEPKTGAESSADSSVSVIATAK